MAALFAAVDGREASAAAPRRTWRTIATPHFRFYFHEGVEATAERLVPTAEPILTEIGGFLGHVPEDPIHVIITDETDSANGFAQVLPQNIINLFPAIPDQFSALGEYDDPLRILFQHELTHVVHLDLIGGLASLVNLVLGKTLSPNQVQPRWFIEGLAVYAESRFSAAGRNRNSMIDMFLRQDVLKEQFLSIDELTSVTRRFPGGGAQWSYGGRFLGYIAGAYGEAVLAAMAKDYGGRIVPYALNVVARRATGGKDFITLWEEWRSAETEKALAVAARVEREGRRDGRPLPRPAEEVYHPAFSSTGRVAFLEAPRRGDATLVFLDSDRATELLRLRTSGGQGCFTPDGERYVSTLFDTYERRFGFRDLEVIDLRTGARRRRTRGARLDEPDVSRAHEIVAVHQEAGETSLVTLSVEGDAEPETIFTPEPGHQVSGPRWSPDGTRILASVHPPAGGRWIVLIDARTGVARALTETTANDQDPVWDPDGTRAIFSSDRGGVFDLHAVDIESREVTRLTRVLTGAFEPALAPGGREVLFVHGVFGGYELRSLEIEGPPRAADPARPRPVLASSTPIVLTSTRARESVVSEPYSPWPTLLPRAWLPVVGSDGLGTTMGAFLAGTDVVGQHSYELTVDYGLESRRPGYSLRYTNRDLPTPISISSSLVATTRPGGFVAADGTRRPESIFRVRAGIDLPLPSWDAASGVALSYGVELRRGITLFSFDPFQNAPAPGDADTTLGSLALSFRFSNVRAFADSISAAKGHAFGLALEMQDPKLGSDFRVLSLSMSWAAYLTLPWLSHHVLATRVAAGGALGDSRGRSVYALGGLGIRNIIVDTIEEVRVGTDTLRGYGIAALRGNAYYVATAEYRLPIFPFSRGLDTLPAFVDRLYAAAFCDVGDTPVDALELRNARIGVGAELRIDVVLGYYLPVTARLGWARGLTEGGVSAPYLVLGGLF